MSAEAPRRKNPRAPVSVAVSHSGSGLSSTPTFPPDPTSGSCADDPTRCPRGFVDCNRFSSAMRSSVARAFDPEAFLTGIENGKTTRPYRSKEVVFSQGDAADAVFFIHSGRVKLTVVSARGKEAVIGVLERGSFFGESCLAGQPLRMACASAIQPSSIIRVGKGTMVRLLHREPEFAELFIGYLLSRNVRIEEDLVDQLFNSSEKRLARILLLLAHFGKDSMPESVVPKVSQETLAAMVGTTRSRVSYFMNRFRKKGFVDYRGGDNGGLRVHRALLTVVLRD